MTREYSQGGRSLKLNGTQIDTGYSGHGIGRNNSDMEATPNVGPIPRGHYTIGPAFAHATKGPVVMRLTPQGHNAHGRTDFLIHGDNSDLNFSASEGCIILKRATREAISNSGDTTLYVTY